MPKIVKKILKSIGVGLVAVILVTIGIDASDNYDNFSESIIGRVIFGKNEGPCPEEMVFVPTENKGFCIDKYEASASESCPYKDASDQVKSRDNINIKDCVPVSKPDSIPWRFISQSQAMAACAKAGKRLPSNEEWYQASLGTPDKNAGWSDVDCQTNSNWPEQPGKTGYSAECVSSFGAYDMIGNVWEWVKGEISEGYFDGKELPKTGFITEVDTSGLPVKSDEVQSDPNFNKDYLWIKESGVRGMARGGYWDNKSDAGIYAMYLVPPSSYAGTGVGFRCAK